MRLGDLDALKEKVALMWGDNNHITESIYEIIDNTPTVDINKWLNPDIDPELALENIRKIVYERGKEE